MRRRFLWIVISRSNILHDLASAFVVSFINKKAQTSFNLTKDIFCDYDAEEDRYIAEIKIRNTYYETCLLEYEKYEKNIQNAINSKKQFLYIVVMSDTFYIFNLTKLAIKKYNFKWQKKNLPKNTHFGGEENQKNKLIGYIHTSISKKYKWINF